MLDYDGFIGELEQSCLVLDILSDVTELVECYDSTLSTLLDKFAPQRQIRVKARISVPWFDADCRRCKAATRKLEKAYRKQPCHVHGKDSSAVNGNCFIRSW